MQIKEVSEKWDISERRIRQLIQDVRIEGAIKIGTTWNIPDDTTKPIDKRYKDEVSYVIDLPDDYFKENEMRAKYYDALDKVMTSHDYTEFIKLVVAEEIRILDQYLELLGE